MGELGTLHHPLKGIYIYMYVPPSLSLHPELLSSERPPGRMQLKRTSAQSSFASGKAFPKMYINELDPKSNLGIQRGALVVYEGTLSRRKGGVRDPKSNLAIQGVPFWYIREPYPEEKGDKGLNPKPNTT